MTSVLCSAFYVLDRRYRSSFLSNHHKTILNIFPSFNDLTLAITWTGGKLNNHKVKVCTCFQRYEKYTKMALSFCRKHLYYISLTLSRFPWLCPRLETFLPIWHLCMKGNERQMSPWWSYNTWHEQKVRKRIREKLTSNCGLQIKKEVILSSALFDWV